MYFKRQQEPQDEVGGFNSTTDRVAFKTPKALKAQRCTESVPRGSVFMTSIIAPLKFKTPIRQSRVSNHQPADVKSSPPKQWATWLCFQSLCWLLVFCSKVKVYQWISSSCLKIATKTGCGWDLKLQPHAPQSGLLRPRLPVLVRWAFIFLLFSLSLTFKTAAAFLMVETRIRIPVF